MRVYRDGDLALKQLMAFAITDDHARQEGVYEQLSYNCDASTIRHTLTETHLASTDRRARFVGVEAYAEAGGTVVRDLFTEDRGGYVVELGRAGGLSAIPWNLIVWAVPGATIGAVAGATCKDGLEKGALFLTIGITFLVAFTFFAHRFKS